MQEKRETKEPPDGQEESVLQEKKVLTMLASMGTRRVGGGGDRALLRQSEFREGRHGAGHQGPDEKLCP